MLPAGKGQCRALHENVIRTNSYKNCTFTYFNNFGSCFNYSNQLLNMSKRINENMDVMLKMSISIWWKMRT